MRHQSAQLSVAPRETARLRLLRPDAASLAELEALHRDPEVMRTLAGVRDAAWTRRFLAETEAHWERHGFGTWLARAREGGGFVGRGGLRRIQIEGCPEVEVGYALRAECWGRGLATELAREACRVGFEVLGLTELVCFTLPENRRSQRVMEKAGFRFERDFRWAELPHRLCRQSAEEWRAQGSGS